MTNDTIFRKIKMRALKVYNLFWSLTSFFTAPGACQRLDTRAELDNMSFVILFVCFFSSLICGH